VRSAKHLNRLIDDLLDISQIEAGVVELKPAPTRLQELIAGVSELIAPLAQEAGLAFRIHLDGTSPGSRWSLTPCALNRCF